MMKFLSICLLFTLALVQSDSLPIYESKATTLGKMCILSFLVIALTHIITKVIYYNFYSGIDDKTPWNVTSIIFFMFIASYGWYYSYDILRNYIFSLDTQINIKLALEHINSREYFYSDLHITACLICYFTYDLLINKPRLDYVIHHCTILGGLLIYVLSEKYTFYVYTILITELSSIFLTLNYLIQNKFMKKINMLLFAISFFIVRVFLIGVSILMILRFESYFDIMALLPVHILLYTINIYWFRLIIKKAYGYFF